MRNAELSISARVDNDYTTRRNSPTSRIAHCNSETLGRENPPSIKDRSPTSHVFARNNDKFENCAHGSTFLDKKKSGHFPRKCRNSSAENNRGESGKISFYLDGAAYRT